MVPADPAGAGWNLVVMKSSRFTWQRRGQREIRYRLCIYHRFDPGRPLKQIGPEYSINQLDLVSRIIQRYEEQFPNESRFIGLTVFPVYDTLKVYRDL